MTSQAVELLARATPAAVAEDGRSLQRAVRAECAGPSDLAAAIAGRFHPVFDVADDAPAPRVALQAPPIDRRAA